MLFKQFLNDDLGCASYLVGDEHAGVAVVVDPPYDVEPVLATTEHHGVRLVGVLETHTHADHVSGHGRLALEHGIPIRVHRAAEATFAHEPLEDGTEVEVGDVVLRTIHTPGHRPEHCCFAVIDRSRSAEPWLVLTGDSLFVGDAGRPDLAVDAQEGAEGLFHSLRRLVELGDGVEVFPGHVAGSLCGAAMSSKASTTIGFERRFNPALQGELADFLDAAAEHGADRRSEPRRAGWCATDARAGRGDAGWGDRARRASDGGVRRGSPSGRGRHPGLRLGLRDQGGVRPASRSSSACSPTTRSICSTCARPTSGTRATFPARSISPTARRAPRPRRGCSTAVPW